MPTTKATTAAPKAAKASQVALGPILADAVYPLPTFMQISGLEAWALREARRAGLRVITAGRRRYIIGADFIRYLNSLNPTENSDDGLLIPSDKQ